MKLDKRKKQNKITWNGSYVQTIVQLAVNQNSECIGELNQKHELNEQHTSEKIELGEGIPLRYGMVRG